jgi:hypothetical protein
MGGINAARHAVRNHALNASQMQSRLDRALLHYHTLLTRNKALQADIQELRCILPFVHCGRSNFFAYTFLCGHTPWLQLQATLLHILYQSYNAQSQTDLALLALD